MRILAIDTSTVSASVAVMDEEKLHGLYYTNYKLKHSEKLLPLVESLLDNINMSLADMDAYALTVGPGSFTGLRIGAATVKGFSYVTGKPIIPVSTLEALVYSQEHFPGVICPILDAQRNQVYCAMFRNLQDKPERICEDSSLGIDEFCGNVLSMLSENEKAVFLGDGVGKFRERIITLLGEKAVFAQSTSSMPSAAHVAKAALMSERRESAYSLDLNYIRKAQAEENLKK